MIYDIVHIKRDVFEKERPVFHVYCERDIEDTDRVADKRGKYEPHWLGFFHFPRKWGWRKAFVTLRTRMIKDRENAIKDLTAEIKALELLELPK